MYKLEKKKKQLTVNEVRQKKRAMRKMKKGGGEHDIHYIVKLILKVNSIVRKLNYNVSCYS